MKKMKFYIPNKKSDETIVLMVRRHPFILLLETGLWLAALLVVPLLLTVLPAQMSLILLHPVFFPIFVIFGSMGYLLIILIILNRFVDYYLDVWIVTNYRILNTEQRQLFSRIIAEHDIDKIQDVAAEIIGMLPTFLNYGDVHVQTAAEKSFFTFEQVPDPIKIKQTIASLCEYRKKTMPPAPAAENHAAVQAP
jgi:hypothetical protein